MRFSLLLYIVSHLYNDVASEVIWKKIFFFNGNGSDFNYFVKYLVGDVLEVEGVA